MVKFSKPMFLVTTIFKLYPTMNVCKLKQNQAHNWLVSIKAAISVMRLLNYVFRFDSHKNFFVEQSGLVIY